MRIFGDYNKKQVEEALLFMEQYCLHEKHPELLISLHILRAVHAIKRGTKFLSELSNTVD